MNKLNNDWTCWIHYQNDNDWTINGYKKITQITDLQELVLLKFNLFNILIYLSIQYI